MQIKQRKYVVRIKTKLKEEDVINVDELSEELFKHEGNIKENFSSFIKSQGAEEVEVDKNLGLSKKH